MNRKRTLITLTALLLFTTGLSFADGPACSAKSVAGDWGYTYTGTIFTQNGPLPLASVGHFTQDNEGNVAGSQNRSVAGQSGLEDIAGTISVNKNCTASATIDVFVNGVKQRTAVLALVYDNNGNQVRAIFQSLTLPDATNIPVVITLDGNKLSPKE
jgi:hypothetical protein